MAFMIPLYVAFLWTSFVSALVILSPRPVVQLPEPNSVSELSKNISVHTETNASFLSLPSGGVPYNTSQSNLNLSARPAFLCDIVMGYDLSVTMCEDALTHANFGPDINPRTWGPREANFDIGLPRRYMSCRVPLFYQLQTQKP